MLDILTEQQRTGFYTHLKREGECLVWFRRIPRKGYSFFAIGPRRDGASRTALVHRLAFELEYGPIPKGLCVLHSCDNPPCCEPEHLSIGTQTDNMRDMAQKGRANRRRPPGTAREGAGEMRDPNPYNPW